MSKACWWSTLLACIPRASNLIVFFFSFANPTTVHGCRHHRCAAAAVVLPRRCLSKLYVSPIRPNETKITAAQAGFRHSSSPHYQHTSPHLTIWRKPYLYLLLTLDPVSRIEFNARLSNSGFKADVLFVGG